MNALFQFGGGRLCTGRRSLAWALLCLAGAAHGQSLLELYRAADAADPTVASARAQHRASLERENQARAAFGVSGNLTLSSNHSQYLEPTNLQTPDPRKFQSSQGGVQFTQALFKPTLIVQLEQTKAQSEQARLQGEQSRIEAMLRFVETAFDMLKARDALRYLRAEQEATAAQLAQTKRSFAVGTVAITDVRDAQAKADAVAAQVSAAEFDLSLKHQLLLDLVGHEAPGLLSRGLEAEALPRLEADSLAEWVYEAHRSSPALGQAQWALEAARQETRKADRAHAPTVEASYGINRTIESGSVTSTQRRVANQIQMGLTLTFPLYSSGAMHSKQREALALQDKAQADVDIARRSLAVSIRQSFSAALGAISQARGLATAVKSQEVALRANLRGYQVGMKVNSEVLAAQSKLFEAQRDLSKARYDAWLAFIKLKGISGQLDDNDLDNLDLLLVPLDQPLELSKDILHPTELPQLRLRPVGATRPSERGSSGSIWGDR
ncbi:TolC family protein [Roseateles sp. DB2]|uniref:TolC family protein n=1 Tax=Roseateles sp. DB2 TaxID=3453717 RepID=UPI003EE91198